jgi:hypothetical protein
MTGIKLQDKTRRPAHGRMVDSAALLVDEILPKMPLRQWVLSVPSQLRFLFASYPDLMGKALGIVYRTIATWLIRQTGFSHDTARTGAVTFIQRFGSALNLAHLDPTRCSRCRGTALPTAAPGADTRRAGAL